MYVEDAAEGIVLVTEKYDKPQPVNLGSGAEISIKNLVKIICNLMDFKGKIRWDKTKPDGQLRRSLDVSTAKKNWIHRETNFEQGLEKTIKWYEDYLNYG